MRGLVAVAAVATLIGVAGCASVADTAGRTGDGSATVPSAPSGPAATAPTGTPPVADHAVAHVGAVTVACPHEPFPPEPMQTAKPLAKNVSVTAVVRCQTVDRSYPGLGTWSVQLAEVANSGFGDFLVQLGKPSLRQPPNIVCTDDLILPPWFALVDQSGQIMRPAVPTDECAKPSADVIAALNRIQFRVVDEVRQNQISSQESVETGCPDQWKDMVALEGANHPQGKDGGSVGDLASSPASALVCLYKAGPIDGGLRVGDLVKGATATGEAAGTIASEAMIVAPLPAGCQDAAEFAVIANSAYVELGGCNRVLTSDGRLGASSKALLAQVKAALGLS
jgi:hypothetical protein